MSVEQLEALEEIRHLKARYCRSIDTKDWNGFAMLFTEDAELHTVGIPDALPLRGRDEIAAVVSSMLAEKNSAHCAHTPLVNVTSPTTAVGSWGAIFTSEGEPIQFGFYDEEYERGDDGAWRIRVLRLSSSFLHPDTE
jgi:uncharacterized protein (TIGR02246 family)